MIDRLAPSLDRHANCDIIDLNPGVGVWSAALHDQVKPRRHLLVEEDWELYSSFLGPLLAKPQSRYQRVPWCGTEIAVFDRLAEAGYLAGHQRFEHGDPRLDLPNDSLLLVVNLGQHPPKRYKGFPSLNSLLFYQLLSAIRTHSALQAYGLVRMLIWIEPRERKTVLPRSVFERRRSSVEAEFALREVVEIAGAEVDESSGEVRREREVEFSRVVEVVKGMVQRGLVTPEHRKGQNQKEAEAFIGGGKESQAGPAGSVQRSWHAELEELESRHRDGTLPLFLPTNRISDQFRLRAGNGVRRVSTPEYARLKYLRVFQKMQKALRERVVKVVDLLDEPATAEDVAKSVQTEQSRSQVATALSNHLKGKTLFKGMDEIAHAIVHLYLDDRRASRCDPPVLLWDRRVDEPLIVRGNDFYPNHELALLDLHPKPLPALLQRSSETFEAYDYILGRLFQLPKHSVAEELEALGPGALEALAPHVPALRDPAKGGHPDLNEMRVRTLTPEMIVGLVKAWEAWPLRPSRKEILLNSRHQLSSAGEDYGGTTKTFRT